MGVWHGHAVAVSFPTLHYSTYQLSSASDLSSRVSHFDSQTSLDLVEHERDPSWRSLNPSIWL